LQYGVQLGVLWGKNQGNWGFDLVPHEISSIVCSQMEAGDDTDFNPARTIIEDEGALETKDDNNREDDNKNKNEDEVGDDDDGGFLDAEEPCLECREDPRIFFLHEELLVAFDEAEHGDSLAGEDVPLNNMRWKKLYRQLTLMLNGGQWGWGSIDHCRAVVSQQSETCCPQIVAWAS
jgi:hypothetical protein